MSYRGRLIWPFTADIARLDTAGTAAAAGAGVVSGGYDPDFKEPVTLDQGANLPDTDTRQETLVQLVPCQVHTEKGQYDTLQAMMSGIEKGFQLRLLMHYVDLEALSLVDSDGSSLFKVNDRLVAIRRFDGTMVRDFSSNPLYVTEAQDRSFGLSGLQRNLLMLTFEDRDNSVPS